MKDKKIHIELLSRPAIKVRIQCPNCWRDWETNKFGQLKCPYCKAELKVSDEHQR